MYNELMLYATGEVVPRRGDRPVAGRAKRIYDDVRGADLMARGAFALGADIMDQTAMLFAKGKALSGVTRYSADSQRKRQSCRRPGTARPEQPLPLLGLLR